MMSNPALEVDAVIRIVRGRGFMNKHLQAILASDGQKQSGVKADLQDRIIQRLQHYASTNDVINFAKLRNTIEHPLPTRATPNAFYQGLPNPSPAADRHGHHPNIYNRPVVGMGGGNLNGLQSSGAGILFPFKPSPFYTVEEQVSTTKTCEVMSQHRHSIPISIIASTQLILSRVHTDPSLRVMIFCRADGMGLQDIAFPHQSDIKINGHEVKANLRGLKNKPGSTRPVDITKELRLNIPHYTNKVEFTYALTNKRFYLSLYVVRSVSVDELVKKLETGKRITKDSVIREMLSKARDTDIIATATALSLKCPLSTLRMDLPCRATSCRHNQCFDGTSYLQLQEQGPTWLCPLCSKPAPFDSLAVDEYVKDILENTSKSIDQVTIEPEGAWKLNSKVSSGLEDDAGSDDEDLVIVPRPGEHNKPTPSNTSMPITPASMDSAPTTSQSNLQQSTNVNGKRNIKAVIDLTSDDDEPAPPPKRALSSAHEAPMTFMTPY